MVEVAVGVVRPAAPFPFAPVLDLCLDPCFSIEQTAVGLVDPGLVSAACCLRRLALQDVVQ